MCKFLIPTLTLSICFHFCILSALPECGTITNCQDPSCTDRSPWHAVILPANQLEHRQLCGGTLISENFIITAAICIQSKQVTAFKTTVILGAGSDVHMNVSARTSFIHSAGNGSEDRNLALIKLDDPITNWNDNIVFVCLPKYNDTSLRLEGKRGLIAGIKNSSETGKHLSKKGSLIQHESFDFVKSENCQNGSNDSSQLCIGDRQTYHSDSCIGDSGGGLVLQENNRFTIVGIIFAETQCKSSHQNLVEKELLQWIRSILETKWFQPQIGAFSEKRYSAIGTNSKDGIASDKLLSDQKNKATTLNKKSRKGKLLNPDDNVWFQNVNGDSQHQRGLPVTTIAGICVLIFLVPFCVSLFFYLSRTWCSLENHSMVNLSRIFQRKLYNKRTSVCDVWWQDVECDRITNTQLHQIGIHIDDEVEHEKLLHSNDIEKVCSASTLQSVANFRNLVFDNWKSLMRQAYPDSSEKIIHSINEVFGLFDHSYHKLATILWNLDNIIVDKMEETIEGIKHVTVIDIDNSSLLINSPKYFNQTLHSLLYHIYGKDALRKLFIKEEDFKLIGINYKQIILRLLPSHAAPLIEAVELLYPNNLEMKAYAVEHIMGRYNKLKYISYDALDTVIKTMRNGTDDNSKAPKQMQECECPTLIVDVTLSDDINISEEVINNTKNKLQTSLEAISTNTRLQDWLWHKYHQNGLDNSLPFEKLTRKDFESISVEIVGIFYGSVIHASIMFKFDIEGGLSNEAMINKLENLELVCKIALENIKDILPQKHKISCNNSIVTVDYDDGLDNAETILLDNLRMIYGRVSENLECRKLLVKKLKDKNITGFNTTEDIVRLFSRQEFTNVDILRIRMSRFDKNLPEITKIDANYIFWPCKTRPLNEMTNKDLSHIYECFEKNIPQKLYKPAAKYFIHSLEIFQNSIDLSGKMLAAVDTSYPFHHILSCLRENGASIEDILISLSQFKKENYNINLTTSENEQLRKSLRSLGETLNKWLEISFEDWKNKYSVELPSSTMSRTEFDSFIREPHHDLRQLKKMSKTELFNIIQNNETYIGVQIWMCRAKKGIHYWHVGILVGWDQEDNCYNIVHVQPRKGVKLEGKIVKEDLNKAVHEDDEILIIYYDQALSRIQITQRALLCCQPPKITFKYNGYLGSCETFCSFICGTRSIKDLNTQGFKVRFDPEEGLKKKMIAKTLHFKRESSADDLLSVIQNRLAQRSEIIDESLNQPFINFSMGDQGLSDRQLSNSSIDIPGCIGQFLHNLGLSELEDLFLKEFVTLDILLELTDENLKEIGVAAFGHRYKILHEARRIKDEGANLYISNSSLEPLSISSGSYGYGSMTSQISFR